MDNLQKRIDWKRPEIITIIISFVVGIAVHMFGLVNVLHNYDDIAVQPIGHGTSLASGRWSLFLFGNSIRRLIGEYNLPWLNGVLFIFLVAVTAGFLVSVLDIKKQKAAVIVGIIFVTFPSATTTLLFKYTAVYDAFALLLSVLAVWFLRKYKLGFIPAAFCIAFSLGIYQAYVPVTISICVLLLIKQVLQEDVKIGQLIWRGVCDCATLLLGLILYFLFLKAFLWVFHTSLNDYQGISEMGNIPLAQIPSLIAKAFIDFCLLPVNEYAGLAQTGLTKIAYVFLGVFTILILLFIAIVKKKNLSQIVLLLLLCITFPIAVNFIAVMCPNSWVYTLMVYSFALVPCVPLVLIEILPKTEGLLKKLQRTLAGVAVCFVLILVTCNAYMANVNYTSLYYANRQTENYLNSMVTQVRLTEGFTPDKKWAPLGSINDPLLQGTWNNTELYGGNRHSNDLLTAYSWRSWINLYHGYALPWANHEETMALADNETVKDMPTWPSEGSIQVIGEYVVIKFEETQ